MNFGGIQKCGTIDFPGILSCVLFTTGCSLNCFYCHNRALLAGGCTVAQHEITTFLEKRQGLLDGVVLSGGEPTLQKDLAAFLRTLKNMGYLTKLDTNGQHTARVRALLEMDLLDYVAVDYKAPENDYAWVCGDATGYARARETILLLLESGMAFEARTTLYPGLSANDLLVLLQSLPPLPKYRLNIFRMPEQPRREDALLFRRVCLNANDMESLLPKLREVQPNIYL